MVADLSMGFLHEGRPAVVREATWTPPDRAAGRSCPIAAISRPTCSRSSRTGTSAARNGSSASTTTRSRRGRWSSHWWAMRDDGPGDASVVLPVRGLDPRPGRRLRDQPALRQARPLRDGRLRHRRGDPQLRGRRAPIPSGSPCSTTSAGATPSGPRRWARWCWRREACHDLALAYGTPFISGKDSLYNEYTHEGRSLAIPPTLLISAIGQVPDVRRCVTMDLKEPGNLLLLAGHDPARAGRVALGRAPGQRRAAACPGSIPRWAGACSAAVHAAIGRGLVRSCHDLSEGGLAVALAEMALAGGLGPTCRSATSRATTTRLAISSCSSRNRPRGSCSKCVPSMLDELAEPLRRPAARPARRGDRGPSGPRAASPRLTVRGLDDSVVIDAPVADLKAAWQRPLRWS